MSAERILTRLRWFLLAMSGALLVGTVMELAFLGHTQEPIQWLPFGLCAVGAGAVGAFAVRPERGTLMALRTVMTVVVLGSMLGVLEHMQGNVALRLEVYPQSTLPQIVGAALGGGNPVMAPGMLALAGVLAMAATYYHPALSRAASRLGIASSPKAGSSQ